jgi:hypothetical protein
VDDVSQVALYTNPHAGHSIAAFLRELRRQRYISIFDAGIALEQGERMIFIGLKKTFDPWRGILLHPRMINWEEATEHSQTDTGQTMSIPPHGRGWHSAGMTSSVVAGMLARCAMLSSTMELALHAAADAFRVMLHIAAYDQKILARIARRWKSRDDRALPLDAVEALEQAVRSPGALSTPGGT